MKIDSVLIEIESLSKNANVVKNTVMDRLVKDKVITEEQARHYTNNWQVIIVKPAWYESWFKKFGKKDGEAYEFKYVKFED